MLQPEAGTYLRPSVVLARKISLEELEPDIITREHTGLSIDNTFSIGQAFNRAGENFEIDDDCVCGERHTSAVVQDTTDSFHFTKIS